MSYIGNNLENDIYYIENVLSCPELFVNFINDLEENAAISKWSDWNSSGNEVTYGSIKHINKDGLKFIPIDSEIYQRSLYIINSIDMAISISFDGYFEKIQKMLSSFSPISSLHVVDLLIRKLPIDSHIHLSSSFAARDFDLLISNEYQSPFSNGKVSVSMNRGVNGIDGVVSTAIGAAGWSWIS